MLGVKIYDPKIFPELLMLFFKPQTKYILPLDADDLIENEYYGTAVTSAILSSFFYAT